VYGFTAQGASSSTSAFVAAGNSQAILELDTSLFTGIDHATTVTATLGAISLSTDVLVHAQPQAALARHEAVQCASLSIAPCVSAAPLAMADSGILPSRGGRAAPDRRIGLSAGGSSRYYLYTPELHLLAETELSTATAKSIAFSYLWFGDLPVAQVDSAGTTRWYATDHLGTPLLQTDASGAVVWRAEQTPYGDVFNLRIGATLHQPLRFPGQIAEDGSSLYYNVFRWYRGAWGRYTQSDPVGLKAGVNMYEYVMSNPVAFTDPTGLRCCPKRITAFRTPRERNMSTPDSTRYGRQIGVRICAEVENSNDCVFRQTLDSGTVALSSGAVSNFGPQADGPDESYVARSKGRICMTDAPGVPAEYIATPTERRVAGLTAGDFPWSFAASFTTRIEDKNNAQDGLALKWTAEIKCSSPSGCAYASH